MTIEQFRTIYRALSELEISAKIEARAPEAWRRELALKRLAKADAAEKALDEAYLGASGVPALHKSVTVCQQCDHYIPVMDTWQCANRDCENIICPDCAVATIDPDIRCCSPECAAVTNQFLLEDEAA